MSFGRLSPRPTAINLPHSPPPWLPARSGRHLTLFVRLEHERRHTLCAVRRGAADPHRLAALLRAIEQRRLAGQQRDLSHWRKRLFSLLHFSAQPAIGYYGIPPGRAVELGMQITL